MVDQLVDALATADKQSILEEIDYILPPHRQSIWITVDNMSLYIHRTDEGVIVDIYALGHEMNDPIGSTYVFYQEAQDVLDAEEEHV